MVLLSQTKYPQTASATAPIFIALPVCLQSSQVSRRWRTWQNLITPATGGKVYSIDVEEKADSGKVSADSAAAGIANDCTCMTAPMYVQAVLKATKAKIKKVCITVHSEVNVCWLFFCDLTFQFLVFPQI